MRTPLSRVLPAVLAGLVCAVTLQAAKPGAVTVELLDAGAGEANDALAQELSQAGFVIGKRERAKAARTESEIFYAKGYRKQALRAGEIAGVKPAHIKPLTWKAEHPIVMAMANAAGVLVLETGTTNVVRVVGAGRSGAAEAPTPPLVAAARDGDAAKVRALLGDGVEVDATDHEGSSALTAAANRGDRELVELLLARDARPRAIDLFWAAHNGHIAIVKILIARGIDPCVHGQKYGDTPLMRAANNGHAAVVKLLGEVCDVGAVNHDGLDALMMAARNGNREEVELLLKLGADPTREAADGRNAREMALDNKQLKVVPILERAMQAR